MSQNNSNVSILSLLDKPSEPDNRKDDSQHNFPSVDKKMKSNEELSTKDVPINEWVSRFQTKLGLSQGNLQFMNVPPGENLARKSLSPEVNAKKHPPSTLEKSSSSGLEQRETVKSFTPKSGISKTDSSIGMGRHSSPSPSPVVLEHLKRYQTSFELSTSLFNLKKPSLETTADKETEVNRTPSMTGDISSKKKQTPKKRDDRIDNSASRKRKMEATDKSQKEEQTAADGSAREETKNKKNGKQQNSEEKKGKKSKKKSAEEENQKVENNKQQKQKISSTMTTEKNDNLNSVSLLPSPTIIEVKGNRSSSVAEKDILEKEETRSGKDEHNIPSGEKQDEANRTQESKSSENKIDDDRTKEKNKVTSNTSASEKERSVAEKHKEQEKEKPEKPIIALRVPLLDPKDPKPGQAEAVVNVLKLAEEKYGWAAMHPNAKSAFEMMDEIVEDEDDGVEEEVEEEDVPVGDEQANQNPSKRKRKENDEEVNEEELARRHEIKMNRKVGKYDYEDPFIDDEELQWEEEITSTKEGFFVYWGPLADDKNKNKKGASKKK